MANGVANTRIAIDEGVKLVQCSVDSGGKIPLEIVLGNGAPIGNKWAERAAGDVGRKHEQTRGRQDAEGNCNWLFLSCVKGLWISGVQLAKLSKKARVERGVFWYCLGARTNMYELSHFKLEGTDL